MLNPHDDRHGRAARSDPVDRFAPHPRSHFFGVPRRLCLLVSGGIAASLVFAVFAAPASAQLLVGDGTIACGSDYTVASGDTLSKIAERVYGDAQLYGFIADANWDALSGNPANISVGMALDVPCVDASGKVLTIEEAGKLAKSIEAVIATAGPLTAEQLDTLFGPVALFPDAVLSRLLVAATFPLDIVKAGRFLEDTAALAAEERIDLVPSQPWDASVTELTAAFPDLVTRMSEHIEWTEQAGEAVLAQTDDVLDSVQRLRATSQENGYLVDNEAQTVVTEGDTISIVPTEPGVVYVPVYESEVVYTTPITSPPAYYYDDDDDWSDAILAGGIFLGGAIILDEIFGDDDWDGWGDWDDDVDIDWDGGDITIDRGDINIGDGERPGIGDGDRPSIGDSERPGGGDRVSIGDIDRPEIGTRPGAGDRTSIGSTASRDVARQKIESRQSVGGSVASLPATRPSASRPATSRPSAGTLPSASSRSAATNRASPVSRPTTTRAPAARAPSSSNAFQKPSGTHRASASSSRGRSSAGGGGRSGRR